MLRTRLLAQKACVGMFEFRPGLDLLSSEISLGRQARRCRHTQVTPRRHLFLGPRLVQRGRG